ncbi:TPA: hypothetical protein J2F85_003459 [Escherichia coli]|nr:hypothetical protein [Escherichia coli]
MNYDKNEVIPKMAGLWKSFYAKELGWNDRHLSKKHGPCPYCFGTDRFRFTDEIGSEKGNGAAVCSKCGSDSGIGWVMKCTGLSFADSVNLLGDWLNLTPIEVIVKANKQASRTQRYKMGAQVDHEKVLEVMQRTERVESSPLTTYEGIYLDDGFDVGIAKDGSMIHAVPCSMVYEDGLGDDFCNLMFIDGDSNVKFLAGDYTRDSVAVIGSRQVDGYTYVVDNFIDGVRIHLATGGREVFVAFSCYNMEMVMHRDKSRKFRVACRYCDTDILIAADDRNVDVVIPNDGKSFKTGIRKKVYKAKDLLN